jgi:predicted nucleic acid-binding protein
MKVFVDTNVIIDLIADRQPFSKWSIELFKKAENKQLQLYSSSHALATTHYLLKKYVSEKELRSILSDLTDFVEIIAVDKKILKKSFQSVIDDFEDAIQNCCAGTISDIQVIITRNKKDFKKSELEIYTPDEFLKTIK